MTASTILSHWALTLTRSCITTGHSWLGQVGCLRSVTRWARAGTRADASPALHPFSEEVVSVLESKQPAPDAAAQLGAVAPAATTAAAASFAPSALRSAVAAAGPTPAASPSSAATSAAAPFTPLAAGGTLLPALHHRCGHRRGFGTALIPTECCNRRCNRHCNRHCNRNCNYNCCCSAHTAPTSAAPADSRRAFSAAAASTSSGASSGSADSGGQRGDGGAGEERSDAAAGPAAAGQPGAGGEPGAASAGSGSGGGGDGGGGTADCNGGGAGGGGGALGRIQPRLMMVFTCAKCETRSTKSFSKVSYTRGVVLVRCPGCQKLHLIADHLRWFGEEPFVLHEFMAAQGGNMVHVTGAAEESSSAATAGPAASAASAASGPAGAAACGPAAGMPGLAARAAAAEAVASSSEGGVFELGSELQVRDALAAARELQGRQEQPP